MSAIPKPYNLLTINTSYNHLTVLQRQNYDPTRTLTLRNRFASDMAGRFRSLRGLIRKAIVNQDVFGLQNEPIRVMQELPGRSQFDFPTNSEKVEAFMNWLRTQVDEGVLEVQGLSQTGRSSQRAWTNIYIRAAYEKGVSRARVELEKAGYDVPKLQETGGIGASMRTPFHVDRVGLAYMRTFEGLKGITAQMDTQISQVLAESLSAGDHPRKIAKKLTTTISGQGDTLAIRDTLGRYISAEQRAITLARTETIRAHHSANIQEYANWEAEGITVQAEFRTAGDLRVCPTCASLEGSVYSLEEARGLIPVHPRCRCMALPYRSSDAGQRRQRRVNQTQRREFFEQEGIL